MTVTIPIWLLWALAGLAGLGIAVLAAIGAIVIWALREDIRIR
jgi:hypothetical protein